MNSPSVVVVGAGVVGCTVRYALAKSGARVQVIETRQPGLRPRGPDDLPILGRSQAHQQALKDLQTAEAAYHRLTAEQAFGRGDDEASRARRLEALTRLDTLRVRLDEIRGHQPPWPY